MVIIILLRKLLEICSVMESIFTWHDEKANQIREDTHKKGIAHEK
jgi:hypothetical protein